MLSLCVYFNGLGTLRCTGKFPGETVSEETSTEVVNEFGLENHEEKDLNSEAQAESLEEEQTQALEFLNDIKVINYLWDMFQILCGLTSGNVYMHRVVLCITLGIEYIYG